MTAICDFQKRNAGATGEEGFLTTNDLCHRAGFVVLKAQGAINLLNNVKQTLKKYPYIKEEKIIIKKKNK